RADAARVLIAKRRQGVSRKFRDQTHWNSKRRYRRHDGWGLIFAAGSQGTLLKKGSLDPPKTFIFVLKSWSYKWGARAACSLAALINETNNGCGCNGRDLNSG
ncbi:MAG: hypothetical protein QG657_4290, partial [Acidobacteriota bacterium]|nr:hypothetical protein [Acidobacteriota bacterium]